MIEKYIEKNRDKLIDTLLELIRIPSVSDTPACTKMLEHVCEIYENNGFKTEKHTDYALAYYGEGERSIGLFAHGDVVPAKDDWIYCDPFEPKIVNGSVFGRGSSDNKVAIVLSLYALKIIKELNIPFKSRLVCFTGANEESSMDDIRNYLKSNTPPDFSLVLDAGFPIYLGDKGILWLKCTKKKPFSALKSFSGGDAVNIILGSATARVSYSRRLFSQLEKFSDLKISRDEDEIIIEAEGISAHGATPNGTKNAAGMILKALMECDTFPREDKEELQLVCTLLNTYDGDVFGISATDSLYGDTTVTNGIVSVENGILTYTLDIRYGSTYTREQIIDMVSRCLEQDNTVFSILKDGRPKVTDENSPCVVACMRAYREFTGNNLAKPRVNAGGTYSRYLDNAVETGTSLEYINHNLPKGHGGAHQSDEFMCINGTLKALHLIINMLIEADKELNS